MQWLQDAWEAEVTDFTHTPTMGLSECRRRSQAVVKSLLHFNNLNLFLLQCHNCGRTAPTALSAEALCMQGEAGCSVTAQSSGAVQGAAAHHAAGAWL